MSATTKPCSRCPEDMQRRSDVTGDATHEWQVWWWECPWCGHSLRDHHHKAAKWRIEEES